MIDHKPMQTVTDDMRNMRLDEAFYCIIERTFA